MIFLEFGAALIILGLCLPLGYILAVTIASYVFRKNTPGANSPPLKMGVLVPAHNEEAGIRNTVKSILSGNYPADYLQVMVIADNCTDATAEEARRAGALVFERNNPEHPGKGQALDWFLSENKDQYRLLEAITIIDADVKIDAQCLREISNSLSCTGVQVVQGYNGVSNPRDGWRPGLCDAAFNVFNHLRVAGLERLSGTAVLKGLGMGFRTEILSEYGWPAHSIVEDREFTLILLKDDIHVHYNPDAVVRSEMVITGNQASSQRSRWEGGGFSLARQMSPMLLRLWLRRFESKFLLSFFELVVPPLALMVLWALLSAGLSIFIVQKLVWLSILQWLVLVLYVLSGQVQRRAPLSTWMYLLTAPLYLCWKLPIYLKMLLGRSSTRWSRTSRNSE